MHNSQPGGPDAAIVCPVLFNLPGVVEAARGFEGTQAFPPQQEISSWRSLYFPLGNIYNAKVSGAEKTAETNNSR